MIGWVLSMALTVPVLGPPVLPEAPPPTSEQVMAVPVQLQEQLQAEVIGPASSDLDRMQRLVRFMGDGEHGLGLEYRDDATYTVVEAQQKRQANCVTYTLVFLALARIAGLEAYPQEIEQTLSWQQRDGIVYRSNHVNARARAGSGRYTIDVGSEYLIARRPAKPISLQRALAQYYNNRAAMLMAERRIQAALAYADKALELDPGYPTTWSNTGVLRLRSGDREGAERAYTKALSLDPNNGAALFNLVALYQRSGDRVRHAIFSKRLDKVQREDPFHQFLIAVKYEKQGDAALAAKHYRRAIRLLGGEHRFYFGLARAYLLGGDSGRARRALRRAYSLAPDEPSKRLYEATLEELSGAAMIHHP